MSDPLKIRRVRTAKRLSFALCAFALLPASGCMYPLDGTNSPIIWGQITHNGKPISNGEVVYYPESTEPGAMEGTAPLENDGTYRLALSDRGLPLPTGWYKIAVRPKQLLAVIHSEEAPVSSAEGNRSTNEPRAEEKDSAVNPKTASVEDADTETQPEPQPTETSEIPAVYHTPKTSKLKLWVRAQPMRVDINLLD